jgi:iron-sulfur cluster assembly accessory protein
MIQLTESAAGKVKELLVEEGRSDIALRVAVQPGGCSGLRYAMYLDDQLTEKDVAEEQFGVRVVIDRMSVPYLSEAKIDFVDSLEASGFTIDNPVAQGSCACGHSFHKLVPNNELDPGFSSAGPESSSGRVEGAPYPFAELVQLVPRQDERGRDLERADPQCTRQDAIRPAGGDRTGGQTRVGLEGITGELHGREDPGAGAHLADQRMIGERRQGRDEVAFELERPLG